MALSALIVDDEQLAREELKYLLDSMGDVEVLAEGSNGIEAVELIEEHAPDLVFLDVQMPGLDGFAVIERLIERARGQQPPRVLPHFIFATAYDQYAVRAFDVNALDYLLKPFDEGRLKEAVDRALKRTANPAPTAAQPADAQLEALLRMLKNPAPEGRTQPAKVVLQTQNRMLLVDQAEICFASVEEGVIRIVTKNAEGQARSRTLEELQEQLDPAHFWRAPRGYLVNIDHIREVVPWFKSTYQLRMNDKAQTEIPVSRAQTRHLRELFNL